MTAGSGAPPIAAPLGEVGTERLDLRQFDAGDLEELAAVFARPEVWHFPYGRGYGREETEAFLAGQIRSWDELGFGLWAARTRHDGRLIGFVGLSVPHFLPELLPAVEVGWRLSPDAWGRGYATEGATAALDEAFTTLGLQRVCCVMEPDNRRSVAVAERLGMSRSREVAVAGNERRGPLTGLLYEIEAASWPLTARPGPPGWRGRPAAGGG